MKKNIVNKDLIRKKFAFLDDTSSDEKEIYHCWCGKEFNKNKKEGSTAPEDNESAVREVYGDILKDIDIAEMEDDVICPDDCERRELTFKNKEYVIKFHNYFFGAFFQEEDDKNIALYFSKAFPEKDDIYENITYLNIDKENSKIYYKDAYSDNAELIGLESVIKYVNKFFEHTKDVKMIDNIFHLQMFIMQVSKIVSDTDNFNVINDIVSNVRNRPNDMGSYYMKKAISVLFGIIIYPNLSTIAIEKDSNFLYNLMLECEIPSKDVMEENKATSPIKIFKFLTKNYVDKLNREINEENKDAYEFSYISKKAIRSGEEYEDVEVEEMDTEKELKIKVDQNKGYKEGKVERTESGNFKVLEGIQDASVSKFIFKNITNFLDFKEILKFFKFINKQQIIELLQKYDKELVVRSIDLIYHRDIEGIKEIKRILDIMDSYVYEKSLEYDPKMDGNIKKDYSFLASFDFSYYDDVLMMLDQLGFDDRHLKRIKSYSELIEYHDYLIKHSKIAKQEEKLGGIKKFVDNFKYLEDKSDYEGPLELQLIDTPGAVLKEGEDMKSSASSYGRKIMRGDYIMARLFDNSEDADENEHTRFTIGFSYNKYDGLEFDQVKAVCNEQGSDRFKKLVMEFLEAKDISYKPIKDLKLKNPESESKEKA